MARIGSFWDERVLPRLVDLSLRGTDLGELRATTCSGLEGRVLEVGFGSGLNIRFYPAGVTGVVAVEPSDVGWELSERRRLRSQVPVERRGLDGQHLDLPDDSADSVLVTFSLCTIPDPRLALREAARVVRPGGRLHFLEHGAAPEPGVRRWQGRLEPLQRRVAGGCHLTRDPLALLAETGWRVEESDRAYLPGPGVARPWTFVYRGVAAT